MYRYDNRVVCLLYTSNMVLKLNPVKYHWRDESEYERFNIRPVQSGVEEYGFLAQELEADVYKRQVYYLQHKIDSARYYFNIASELAEDIRDDAQLAHLSIQIELSAGNSEEASNSINEYIGLSDSVSRMVVSQSATAADGKYYKEQTAFASYRLKVRTYFEYIVGLLICAVAIFLIYYLSLIHI